MSWRLELEKVVPRWSGGDFVYGAFADEGRPARHIVGLDVGARLCVGRSPDCEISVPVIHVTRRHCEIWRDEAGVWLRDLHSNNGTFLGERRAPPGTPVPLRLDDVVRLAEFAVVLTARFEVPPSWRDFQNGLIPHLARGVVAERRFADLPILADALEDAGCDLNELLRHLHEEHPRERRCWVVKRLLRGLGAVAVSGQPGAGA
jgi:hypothetical protein